jgi:hypothetical protein
MFRGLIANDFEDGFEEDIGFDWLVQPAVVRVKRFFDLRSVIVDVIHARHHDYGDLFRRLQPLEFPQAIQRIGISNCLFDHECS